MVDAGVVITASNEGDEDDEDEGDEEDEEVEEVEEDDGRGCLRFIFAIALFTNVTGEIIAAWYLPYYKCCLWLSSAQTRRMNELDELKE